MGKGSKGDNALELLLLTPRVRVPGEEPELPSQEEYSERSAGVMVVSGEAGATSVRMVGQYVGNKRNLTD